jgi:hypothetical protein
MNYNDLSPELREKAKACTSPEEVLELAKNEGYELSDEELADISGGLGWTCDRYKYHGDSRVGVNPSFAHADYVNGIVDGGED